MSLPIPLLMSSGGVSSGLGLCKGPGRSTPFSSHDVLSEKLANDKGSAMGQCSDSKFSCLLFSFEQS